MVGNKNEQRQLDNLPFSSSVILVVWSRSYDWSCASFLLSSFRQSHSMTARLFSSRRRITSASKPALQLLLPTTQQHLSVVVVIKWLLTCSFPLFITELDDQVLVLGLLHRLFMVGGFKSLAQAFHLRHQLLVARSDRLDLVKSVLAVTCGLH